MHRFVSDGQAALAQVPNGLADQRERLERDLGALRIVPLPAATRPAAVVDRPGQLGWGYVVAGSSLQLESADVPAAIFRWRMGDREGAGAYELMTRATPDEAA